MSSNTPPSSNSAPASEPVQDAHFSSMLRENRVFPPPAEFAAKARIGSMEAYEAMYARSIADPEGFWAEAAKELHWFKPWTKVLDWQLPHAQWFVGGKLNLCYNCVDRHALGGRRDHVAILWEGEPSGEVRRLTYGELHIEVQKFASVLKQQGIRKGDRVAVYMGMTPGTGDCSARLRAYRCHPFRHLRRLCGACIGRSHQ